jgi:hypothetical protein
VYHLKRNPKTISYYGIRTKSEAGPLPCNRLSQPPPNTRVKVILVARPLLTPASQNCVSAKVLYSRAERLFILEHYFLSQSFAAVSEAFNKAYPDKEVQNRIYGHRKCLYLTNAHRATKQKKLRLYCFQAVHQLQQRNTATRVQYYHRFRLFV